MSHSCPSPGCELSVPSSQFACRVHWYRLPSAIRDAIWEAYRVDPLGDAHIQAMTRARRWLEADARMVDAE